MKLNKILMVLAATAIVGCTSEDLNDFSAKQAPEDSRMIELNENFVLAGVGVEGNLTRTHWYQDPETKGLANMFLPIYATAPGTSTLNNYVDFEGTTNYPAEAVGLCWLGETAGAEEVYTNYQFFHFGWLDKGETEADVDNCTPFKLYNGSLYSDITTASGAAVGDEADPEHDFATIAGGKNWDDLNYNSGVYKTNNKTIFGGQYIVYYPYDPEFQEKGTIPAKAVTSFKWDPTALTGDTYESAWLGEATFRYSAPVRIEGGMNAANFGLYNLSTLVRLRVFTATAADAYKNSDIDQVVLLSESGKFVKEAKLGADKIADKKQGQELYASTEGTKTVSIKFTAATDLQIKKDTKVSAYFTVLPTTVDDLVALVHNKTHNFWYRVELPATEFEAGKGQVVDITVRESDITSDYVVVDDASLRAALGEAETAGTECTISLIGDVTLTSDLNINQPNDRLITIDGGDIIVPQDVELTLTTLKEMKSNVRVLGKDCCKPGVGGKLTVTGADAAKDATILHNVTLEKTEARCANATEYDNNNPTLTYKGAAPITIADDATVTVNGGNVYVEREVAHKGAFVNGKNEVKDVLFGAKVTVKTGGNLKFMGDAATVENNGIIEVLKGGQYNMTDANNNANWAQGTRMTNKGKFIHNVDAGVGTAVQAMDNQGEYRCKVNSQVKLDNAYLQWTACNVIEIVASGSYNLGTAESIETNATAKTDKYKHNNDFIDIEITGSAAVVFTNPGTDTKEIKIGDLTVTKGTLDVKYAEVVDKGKRKLTVNGNMTVNDDATISSCLLTKVTGNLTITEANFKYVGGRYGGDPTKDLLNGGLDVKGDIKVIGNGIPLTSPKDPTKYDDYTAIFDASDVDALNIKCASFSLDEVASAKFGNQTSGGDKNLAVSGTISNPKGCLFDITAAGAGVIAWVECTTLNSGGLYTTSEPLVVPAE